MGQGRGRRVTLVDRLEAVNLIREAQINGACVQVACEAMGIGVRTFERWSKNPDGDQRHGPVTEPANKLSSEERERVIELANSKECRDKSPAQIVPQLADKSVYVASESTFYRILKEEGMNAHRLKAKPRKHVRPPELKATGPNQVWSWDITYLQSQVSGIFFYLYLVVDVYSRKIIGFDVKEEQTADYASTMIRRLCLEEGIKRGQLKLHSDNGKPMKGATMLATLQHLGVVPSFSRPYVSDDNAISEALFRTFKYRPNYPSLPFASMASAREWVMEFIEWYNEQHLHSGIKFVTPSSRHNGEDAAILENRKKVYEAAKAKRPDRWSGATRNWEKDLEVFLNRLQRRQPLDTNISA